MLCFEASIEDVFVLFKSSAAGKEHRANAVRDKGLYTARISFREWTWREEAGANQLWFRVSCWDFHREREAAPVAWGDHSNQKKKMLLPLPLFFLISILAYFYTPHVHVPFLLL